MTPEDVVAEDVFEVKENFAELLEESIGDKNFEGRVVKGTVLSMDGDAVLIDVGMKSEGRVPLKEFGALDPDNIISVGDVVDVFIERYEDRDGMIRLSAKRPGVRRLGLN